MLPTDMELIWDKKFKPFVELYAKDEEKFSQVSQGSGPFSWHLPQIVGKVLPEDLLQISCKHAVVEALPMLLHHECSFFSLGSGKVQRSA